MHHCKTKYLSLLLLMLLTVSCNYNSNLSGAHYFLGMHDMHAIEAQEEDDTTLNLDMSKSGETYGMDSIKAWAGPGSGLRTPPAGTIPRGTQPYPYKANDFDAAAKGLKNPLVFNKSNLKRGQEQYTIHCSVCHGHKADGKGAVTPRFAGVPSLINTRISNWNNGRIFHIITMGRARMKPFAAQIEAKDRWALIYYLRLLQKKGSN